MTTWIVFFVVTLPFCIWAAWSDLKFMKIPNILAIMLALVFVVVGVFVLPFDEYLWRLLVGLIALGFGFLVFATGIIGGGDVKLIAAMLPFVARPDLFAFAFVVSVMTLSGVLAHRLIKKFGMAPEGWVSWQGNRKYPFGLSLAGAMMVYLALNIFASIGISGTVS